MSSALGSGVWTRLRNGVKLLIGLGTAFGLAFGVWKGSQAALRKASERELTHAWAAFAKCSLGEAPLADDLPSVRYRAIQLGLTAGANDWPARCRPYQAILVNASQRAARFGLEAFGDDLPEVRNNAMASPTPEQLDKLYRDALDLPDWPVGDLRGVPSAPPPTALLVKLSALKPLALGPVLSSDPVARGDLRLLFADRVCWLRAADALATASCLPITVDGAESHLGGGEDGVGPLVLPRGDWGYVTSDGTSLLVRESDPFAIVRTTRGGKPTRLPLGRFDGHNTRVGLFDDALFWVDEGTLVGGTHGDAEYCTSGGDVRARTVSPSGQLGTTTWLANECEEVVENGCRTSEALFLRGSFFTYTRLKNEWLVRDAGTSQEMSCNGSEVVFVGILVDGVQQTRCLAGACASSTVSLDPGDRLVDDRDAATSLGDLVVTARRHDGLRVRVARLTDLPTAPERLLLDGEPGQPGSVPVSGLTLYARGPFAVLVVASEKGTYAFRIDSGGNVTTVEPN